MHLFHIFNAFFEFISSSNFNTYTNPTCRSTLIGLLLHSPYFILYPRQLTLQNSPHSGTRFHLGLRSRIHREGTLQLDGWSPIGALIDQNPLHFRFQSNVSQPGGGRSLLLTGVFPSGRRFPRDFHAGNAPGGRFVHPPMLVQLLLRG